MTSPLRVAVALEQFFDIVADFIDVRLHSVKFIAAYHIGLKHGYLFAVTIDLCFVAAECSTYSRDGDKRANDGCDNRR
jgi:hypothetical protein